jgi:uncharacterized protein YecE (DUF72 family)
MAKHPRVEPIRNLTLFEMDKLEQARNLANSLNLERPYSEPGLLLGTSAFTANGWAGAFYRPGMKPHDFLSYSAKQFKTVEIDSTYYGTPSASTVTSWYEKTPPDFVFAAKVPQVVTHEKVLVNCEAEFDEYIDRMHLLGEKLRPLLLQFRWFNKYEIQADEFFRRLQVFLNRMKDLPTVRFVVEIRNKAWLDKRFTDLLREHNVENNEVGPSSLRKDVVGWPVELSSNAFYFHHHRLTTRTDEKNIDALLVAQRKAGIRAESVKDTMTQSSRSSHPPYKLSLSRKSLRIIQL